MRALKETLSNAHEFHDVDPEPALQALDYIRARYGKSYGANEYERGIRLGDIKRMQNGLNHIMLYMPL